MFLRSAFGGLVLFAALRLSGRKLPPRSLLGPLAVLALLNSALPWTLFPLGEQGVTSNIASILNATTPLFTLVMSLALRDAQVHSRMVLGVFLGLAGVAITAFGGVSGGYATLLGVMVLLLAAWCYAAANITAKRYLQAVDPVGLATAQLGLSTLMLLPLAAFGPHPAALTWQAMGAVAFLGVVGSGFAYLLLYGLLQRLPPTQMASVTYTLPVWGVFWGALAGERMTLATLAGVLVVLLGLLLINWRPRYQQQRHVGQSGT